VWAFSIRSAIGNGKTAVALVYKSHLSSPEIWLSWELINFDFHVTVHRDKFLIISQLEALISQIYFGRKIYMIPTVPLSITRSFSLYVQLW